jgi:hypothetical protein
MHRGHDPQRYGQADSDGNGHGSELERIHQPWPDQLADCYFVLNAFPQVPLHSAAQPAPVLHQHGLIEPIRLIPACAGMTS